MRWGFGKPRIRDDPEVIMRLLLVHPSAHVYSEAIDAESLEVYRKRVSPDDNFRAREAARGQANFVRMLWRFNKVCNGGRQYADHHRPARYELPLPSQIGDRRQLYVHSRPWRPGARAAATRNALCAPPRR